jgi:hypothetical protein
MAAQSKMAVFYFLFSKIWQKSTNKDFSFCKMIFMQKYSYFLEKIKVGEKSKMAAKNQDGVG